MTGTSGPPKAAALDCLQVLLCLATVPFRAARPLSDEDRYNQVHAFYRSRVEQLFGELWSFSLSRNEWRGRGTHGEWALNLRLQVLVQLLAFNRKRVLKHNPVGPWKHSEQPEFSTNETLVGYSPEAVDSSDVPVVRSSSALASTAETPAISPEECRRQWLLRVEQLNELECPGCWTPFGRRKERTIACEACGGWYHWYCACANERQWRELELLDDTRNWTTFFLHGPCDSVFQGVDE
eukprot:NODE_1195_length_1650_cov_32.297314_g1061_i0.p1 GENE.NODE_1195_length_1650_cov_32.297314_g1061_i0~~NODE_1195_length_1650_cov_32.297314_g1061_i0.p1  ORF type:complete len:238 (-),score=23.37 NODE_1195_length_1650_cov_32.297314_g1061_i0:82-795(-)